MFEIWKEKCLDSTIPEQRPPDEHCFILKNNIFTVTELDEKRNNSKSKKEHENQEINETNQEADERNEVTRESPLINGEILTIYHQLTSTQEKLKAKILRAY